MEGAPPPEEDFSTLSIEDRLSHKNWKARVSAYETLVKTFQNTASDNDPAFRPYLNNPDLLKKIATDSNAVAQEKGVDCLVAFVKFAGENAARTREAVVPALVDKCFGSTRAGTRNQAIELALQYVEVENSGAGVIADIIPGLSAKQPKVVSGCVTAMKEIVRLFGIQVIPPQPVLKALPKIFGHSDKTVRAEGTALTHALYQYMGPAIETFLGDLKPVQVKELKEAFENMEKEGKGKGTLKPERLTRQQAREAETAQMTAGDDAEAPGGGQEEADPRSFAEEVDITGRLPANFYGNLSSSKWKERKEALDDLQTLLNASLRIKDAPELGELAKSLATCIHKDANVACVTTAANCMEKLAEGVATPFGRFREAVVAPMMERLKERKASVTDAIGAALDAVFKTTALSDILGDIQPMLSNKNPQVKEGSLKFLTRCLSNASAPIQPAQIKPLSDALAALLEDSVAGCRDEAAMSLGTLMKMVGERPLNALMDGLADVRKAKVKEAYDKATVKCKAGGAAPAKPPPAAKAAPPKAAPVKPAQKPAAAEKAHPPPASAPNASSPTADDLLDDFKEPPKPSKKPPARLMAKKLAADSAANGSPSPAPAASAPVKKLPPAAAPKASGKSAPAAPPGALDSFKYKHTPEDAEALWTELIPANFQTDLGDSAWKVRLAALEEMTTWVEGAAADLDSEVVVRFLAKKGFNEKNFQVSAKLYGILQILATRCPSFGRSSAALCIPHLSEKLGDMKLKKPAGDTLLLLAEKTSLQFVLGHAYEPLSKQKAPKVFADALVWVDTALKEFGIAGLSLRGLIEFLKDGLKNSNAGVRTSATKTLVTVKLFAGSSIKDFLEDLNPQLLNTISSEFDKVEGTPAPEPTRESADVAAMATTDVASGKGSSTAGADPLDDLFPRVEIDGLLKGTTILADAKSDAWKTKKEALETLQAILDQGANKRLKPNMGEIGQVLKARVTDANKAVQMLALDIVARIATGMGKPFEKYSRLFDLPVATVLADQKAPARQAACQTLTAMAIACEGVDPMVKGLTTALESPNPMQRATLLGWMVDWFKEHEPSPSLDISSWVNPVVSCLDDRSADVRKGAQGLLPTLITCCGYDTVMSGTNALKPASRKSAAALIQAAQANAAPRTQATASVEARKPAAAPAKAAKPRAPSPPPAEEPTPALSGTEKVAPPRRKLLMGAIPKSADARPETPSEEAPRSRLPSKPGLSLRRPAAGSVSSPTPPVPADNSNGAIFITSSPEPKRARLAKDGQRWINESGTTRKDLADLLQHQMEPHASKELVSLLFSNGHTAVNDHVKGLSMISDYYTNAQASDDLLSAVAVANCDLPLKYVSIKAHEPQSNLISKCLEVVEAVLSFLSSIGYQLTDAEALCFIPTMVYKLGDAREQVRVRVQAIIQSLPKVDAYSRVFQLVLQHGLSSKVAKTRQGAIDELGSLIHRFGISACEPAKALPQIAAMISDKDPSVRKSALTALSEAYTLVGEKIWSLVGHLSPKDKTQLEERLRRVAGPSSPPGNVSPEPPAQAPATHATRLQTGIPRSGSPAPAFKSKIGGLPRPASPAVAPSRLARPSSPSGIAKASTLTSPQRPTSPLRPARSSNLPSPASPVGIGRPKTLLPSRLGPPKARPAFSARSVPPLEAEEQDDLTVHQQDPVPVRAPARARAESVQSNTAAESSGPDNVSITISSILSSDPTRSVDALKRIQRILELGPEAGPSSPAYRDLAEHTEGLIETITLQMAHVFDRPDDITLPENFRLAKHLIQTLNAFCDHVFLAESLTVDILTSLLEELTLRLLETDDSPDSKVKDLSRFINMIILRLFATARRMSVFRALFALLLQIVKPFPSNGTPAESKEAKIAELVLKCIWKLARNMPQDLEKQALDPIELFPAIEHFLQSVPPNEWRARATNKVPCGDMPLRTIKVIIQHVVGFYGDDVYDILSGAFDDPSATIVYPYVYRILNSSTRVGADMPAHSVASSRLPSVHRASPSVSRPISPPETASSVASGDYRPLSETRRTSQTASSVNGNGAYSSPVEEPDPDAQLITIINHISSETTGALHKEGITELHQFLKAHPHKKPKVDKMLESTGPAFRKYITRALASRAAEDQERDVAVAHTLSKLEANQPVSPVAGQSPSETISPRSPRSPRTSLSGDIPAAADERLSRLHNLFQYNRASTASAGSSNGRAS
ncbi:microtubule associated protein [Punctularia strigosozonata HHB-11173 SS5]|uniref:microtubule associated protein n=1 Tax=Punctularia strigosozonata (strain HHB-11173) TaxID=741275 RepID=UPI00044179D2|nr:microtubule associated protein [Punctularia strigosozonata HHB-11173 SS5]EIN07407.1 microtubule associated protein [Punctularia strigosozonata HHB-11173 SS5]